MSEETAPAVPAIRRPPVPVPRTIQEQLEFAKVVVKSGLSLGHKTAESVVIALQLGAELGFTPMQALRCITVINGRPAPNADACVAAALSSDVCDYFIEVETTETQSTWETKRKGDPKPSRYTFTLDDAKRAKLQGDNWQKYPKRMLAARAKKYLAQDKYPDVLGGLLSEEEARDIVEFSPSPVHDPEPVVDPPPGDGTAETSSPAVAPPVLITEGQVADIDVVLRDVGETEKRLMGWLKYGKKLEDIRAVDYAKVIAKLEDKRHAHSA